MNKNQQVLLNLIGHELFDKPTELVIQNSIIQEAKLQAVEGLINKHAYAVFVNNAQILHAHAEITSILQSIPFVTMKGYASAYYYPQPIRRTMGDVDFLVHSSDISNAQKRLLQAGFERMADSDTQLHRCYKKNGVEFEMHQDINGIPLNDTKIHAILADTIQTARDIETEDGIIRIPDNFHNGWICLLHILSHMKNSGIGLRHFCDWACFVNKVQNFEELFKESFESTGLWNCARIFSLTAVKYLGLSYQSWMGEADDSVLDALMEEIMSAGNFGRANTSQESNWFIDKSNSNSKVKGLVSSLNRTVKKHWPVAKRVPFLYPVGWVFFSARYLIRIAIGKRDKINIKETFTKADKKNKLLKDLKLFEPQG